MAQEAALLSRTEVTRYRAVKKHLVLKTDTAGRQAADLDRKIETYIGRSDPGEAAFNQLALELFSYQFQYNAPYRNLCEQRRRTPAQVTSWSEIPALSAASFADARIASFPPQNAVVTFTSSGTTRAGERPSRHELETLRLYDASLLAHFRRCVLPDREKIPMVLLSPPLTQAPNSSLAYMLAKVFETHGSGGGFFIRDDKLDFEGAADALRAAREPTLVFGTALAFMHFLERCESAQLRFALPPGSRIVETGGFKGKVRSIEHAELYDGLVKRFGIPRELCISEYGMCELGSQWYDAGLSDALAGRTPREQLKIGPHWARTLIVDEIHAKEVPAGTVGLLQCFDLSNRGSVAAVLTGDLARSDGEGFVFAGRSAAAPPKGCSIAVDRMLHSSV